MIRASHVSREYRNGESVFFALNDASLSVERGEFVSILGPSGSGKSTLMHLIGGLDHPSAGTIEIDGRDLSRMDDKALARFRNRTIGFVFQFFNLIPHATALENVVLPLLYRRQHINRKRRAEKVLQILGLGSKLGQRPNQLSGGEQQRVAIARALVNSPDILLADEPTGNLDSKTGLQIIDILSMLSKRAGKTVVMVTHDLSLAERADRIIYVQDGRVVSQ